MASKNKLLGKTEVKEPEMLVPETSDEINPIWMFHADFPEQIVKSRKRFDELVAQGWTDHPGKCRKLPGFEDLYEGAEKAELFTLDENPDSDEGKDKEPEANDE